MTVLDLETRAENNFQLIAELHRLNCEYRDNIKDQNIAFSMLQNMKIILENDRAHGILHTEDHELFEQTYCRNMQRYTQRYSPKQISIYHALKNIFANFVNFVETIKP